jgi:mannose/fructose/N-acetylgalactosamine-specific phosphotransferase system component IIC
LTPWTAESALLVVAGAVLALDHAAWPSLLLAQPLVAGALAGAVLGQPQAGLAAGAVVQLLSLKVQPVGGVAVPEAWLGGLAAALCAPPDVMLRGNAWLDDGRLAPAAAIGVLAMWLGRAALGLQRRLQSRLAAGVAARVARGDLACVARAHATGLVLHAGRGAVLVTIVLVAARPCAATLAAAGVTGPAGRLALAVGAATLGYEALRRRRALALCIGAAVGLLVALVGPRFS